MAAALKNNVEDTKQTALSPRLKGRGMSGYMSQGEGLRGTDPWMAESAKETLCRNVTIYGKCRYEDKGAVYAISQLSGRCGVND